MKKTSPFLVVLFLYISIIFSCSVAVKTISANANEKNIRRITHFLTEKFIDFKYGYPERIDDPRIVARQNLFDVSTYELNLSFNFEEKRINGIANISIQNLSDTLNEIYLNLYGNMKVENVKLNNEDVSFYRGVKFPPLKDLKIDDNTYKNYLVINSKGKSKKSDIINILIYYEGKPRNTGFDSFSFKEIDKQTVVYSLSEPTFAPTWFPCKDILSDKFICTMNIEVPDGMVAASNGLLKETKKLENGNLLFEWNSSYPISSYLVSFVVAKFDHWNSTYTSLDGNKEMPVDYYSFPSYTERAKKEWNKTTDMISYFSKTFGEYPFINEKYGMAMFGWTSGAMEHQTLTSMGYTLVTGTGSSEEIIAHELAHQWFGDAVTPATWYDVWLNEGFATYSEILWKEHLKGKGELPELMSKIDYGYFKGTVYKPDGLIFNSTVYQKGAWCLHMLRGEVGDSVFFKILRKYYDVYKYKNASTNDFKKICEDISGKDLTDFFDQWIFKGTGRPDYEYSFKVDDFMGEKSKDSIYQLRLNIEQKQKDYEVYKMPIKITVITEFGEQEFTVFNFKKIQQFEQPVKGKIKDIIFDKDDWILKEVNKVDYKDVYDKE